MRQRPGIKTIPIMFALLLIMGTFVVVAPNMVSAAQEGDYTYTVSNGNATVTGYTGAGGAITIPSTLGGFATQTIGDHAFDNCTNITSVTIPNSVISIGNFAFQNCTNLSSITIPDGVLYIGDSAFSHCTSLISVIIPDGVTTIEFSTFAHCTSLISVTIPISVTVIQDSAFRECGLLTSIILPANLDILGDAVFDYCTSLTSITIPTNVSHIGAEAFAFCNALTSATFLGNVDSFDNHSFYNCRSMVSITFYGLVAPSDIREGWINATPLGLRGHAYAASNFPPPGGNFFGLVMGAVIPVVPSAPTNFVAAPGNVHVLLTWNLPSDNGSIDITGYRVYSSSSESGTYSLIGSPAVLSFTNNALTNGQTYWYKVSAVNAVGEGAKTAAISAIPFTVPNSPTGMKAVAGNSKVTLNWTAPVSDGGRAIDYYVIYQDGVALSDHQTGTTTVITGLTNGQNYSFTVAAHNLAGLSNQSNLVTVKPNMTPDAPTVLIAVAGNHTVTLNWTAPAYDGGNAIDYYVIYQDGVALPNNVTGLNTTITGLTNGQNYSFTVAAHNLAGIGAQSNMVASMPYTVPDAPTGLTAIRGSAKVTLNWTAPAFNGGRAIDYYVIYQDGVALPNNVTGLNTTINGLTNGQEYSFTVAAHNLAGIGAPSNTVVSTPYTIPDAPTGFNAMAGTSEATLNWTAPAFDGGNAIDYYVIYQDGVALPNNVTGLNTTITGLTNGQNYSFTVAAHNLAGLSNQSNSITVKPFIAVPGAPTGLFALVGSSAKVVLNWTAPVLDGGSPIDYYIINQSGVALPNHYTGTTTVISGLTNGQNYSFTVAAHNAVGLSAQSNVATAKPYGIAGAPTGLTALAGNSNVTLNWTAPASNGGSAILYYVVSQDGIELFDHPTGISVVVTGLNIGQNYSFTVAAYNLAGLSNQSNVANVTAIGLPGAPLLVSIVAGHGSITLTWTAPANNGSPITGYKLYWDTANPPVANLREIGPTVFSATVTGLTAGTTYYLTVSAVNAAGEGNKSVASSAKPYTVPNAPNMNSPVVSGNQVTLTWTANGNGSNPITSYKLYRSDTENGSYELIASQTGLSYINTGLVAGNTYWYKVSAVNAAGEGANSIAKSVVVPQSYDYIWLILIILIVIIVIVAVLLYLRGKSKK